MWMFLALSSLFWVMVLVQSESSCPNHPATVDCDMCELLMAGDSSFMQNCGSNFSPDMIASIGTDCGTYQKNGQVEDFLKNMHMICDQKNQPFEDPICECTMCSQLLASNSSFIQNCGQHLSADLLDSIKLDCVMYEDAGAFDDFLKNMHLICDEKDTPFDDPPPCNCTICGLLLDPASSFMKNCGQNLSADLLDSIRTDCVMYEEAGEVDAFLENMHLICDEKNNSFVDPECECVVCKELLDEESSFMVNCGQHLSTELLESIGADCAMYDKNKEVDEFLKNMHLICDEKDYPFKDPCECPDECHCEDKHMDVIFMIDESGSINDIEYTTEKNFVIDVIEGLDIADDKTRVGVITYGTKAVIDITLPNANDASLNTAINGISRNSYGLTSIASAIDSMNTMFTDDSLPENSKVGVVLTDGYNNRGDLNDAVVDIAADVMMISVGIGGYVNDAELLFIAGHQDRVLKVGDMDSIDKLLGLLPELICEC